MTQAKTHAGLSGVRTWDRRGMMLGTNRGESESAARSRGCAGCAACYAGPMEKITEGTVKKLRKIADAAVEEALGQDAPQQRDRWGAAATSLIAAVVALDAARKGKEANG